jgi:arginyl-tRNA synthetase
MPSVAAHLTALVAAAVEGLAPGSAVEPCVPTRDAAHGDYQSNVAFRLAKTLGQSPRAVADQLAATLRADPAVERVDVAGAGFLNFALRAEWLADHVRGLDLGPRPPVGRAVVIDYSSPNIAKRMHVGHLRSTIIGNALDRMYRWRGWTVIADNHVGDWGTPFGKLIVAWQEWRDEAAYAADPVGELQRLYELADRQLKEHPELLDRARAETVRLQAKDPATLALWKQFVDVSMAEYGGIYARLGVRFDEVLGESAYDYGLQSMVDRLLASGVAVESEGAVVIPFPGDKQLADHPMLLRKRDGAALYGTSDLVCAQYRVERWHPERVLVLTDTRQQLHFKQLFAAARLLGLESSFVHVWFGMLKFPDGSLLSSRKGGLNLVDVLDTAAAKAFEVVTAKSPDVPEAERREIAEAVGTAAVRYFDLSQNPQSDITFDWDRALSLDSGSAVYLQYAYARLHSILRKGGADEAPPAAPVAVSHAAERALAVLVARLPEAIDAAAEASRPNLLAEHLEALAKAVGPFYDACPVLRDDVPADVRAARLALVHAVAGALRTGLELLGIKAIPRL